MATAKRAAKKKGLSIDFTGVESGGGGRLLPEGQVIGFTVDEVEQKTSDNSGQDYLSFTLKVTAGEYQGVKVWDNMSLQPQALWKLRGFLEAAGFEVPDGVMDLDINDLTGLGVSATIIHEEYQGKKKNRIEAYVTGETSEEDDEEPEEESEEPAFTKGDTVQFRDGKKLVKGKVTGVEGDAITVKVGADEYEITADELTKV